MSTQEQISSRNLWVTYVRRVLGRSKDFALLNFNILFKPTWIGTNVILDNAGLLRAAKFYSKAFALFFAILLIANRFQLYEGKSEWRDLIRTIVYFVVGITIIYVLCLALRNRISFSRMVQAGLYTFGAWLVVAALVAIPVYYLDTLMTPVPTGNRQLDILKTELEHCFSDNSIFYWLLRGDLKFYLYADAWKPWANWFFENYYYFVAIPFFFIFARMLRPASTISFAFVCVVTAVGFIAASEGLNFAEDRLRSLLAARDKCTSVAFDQITNKYAPDLVAGQIVYKIDSVSQKDDILFSSLAVHGTNVVAQIKVKPDIKAWQKEQIPAATWQAYCSDSDPYWRTVRRINYNLTFLLYDNDGTLLHQEQITPKDCP